MEYEYICSRPEVIADYACEVGENPLWHPDDACALWTDIARGRIFRYRPDTGTTDIIHAGRLVGGFTIQQDGSLLLFKDRGTITCWWAGHEVVIVPVVPVGRELRFNDVIADPVGRVFCGTYTDGHRGRLYRLDTDGSLTKLLDDIGCSNGMAFTLDRTGLYYIESLARSIYPLDYDVATGELCNQRVFCTVTQEQRFPDGCTVDEPGLLWFALRGGSALVRLRSEGEVVATVAMPTRKITSLIFGGVALSTMFVTREGGNSRSEQDLLAGATFSVNCRVSGRPEFRSGSAANRDIATKPKGWFIR